VLWDVRRLLPVYIGLRQVPGEDGGDVFGAHAVQVQVDLLRALDRGPGGPERLSGPAITAQVAGSQSASQSTMHRS
jgi:hypothetical protein